MGTALFKLLLMLVVVSLHEELSYPVMLPSTVMKLIEQNFNNFFPSLTLARTPLKVLF